MDDSCEKPVALFLGETNSGGGEGIYTPDLCSKEFALAQRKRSGLCA